MSTNEEKYKILLSGYIDGELNPDEEAELKEHLKGCSECRKELEAFEKLKEVTGAMKYADIPEHVWENYWRSMYRRFELGLGWIFLSIGVILILCTTAFYLIKDFFLNPAEPIILKIGIAAAIVGFIILLVSVLRERIFAFKRDRYSEIQR